MKIEEFARLKRRIEALRHQKARAEGALEQVERKLMAETGSTSVEEARASVKMLRKKAERLRAESERRLEQFVETWGEKLEGTK